MKNVEFGRAYTPNAPGDIAGIADELAETLIAAKVCKGHGGEPKEVEDAPITN